MPFLYHSVAADGVRITWFYCCSYCDSEYNFEEIKGNNICKYCGSPWSNLPIEEVPIEEYPEEQIHRDEDGDIYYDDTLACGCCECCGCSCGGDDFYMDDTGSYCEYDEDSIETNEKENTDDTI